METEIIGDVVKKLNLRFAQVKNVIELLAQGSTIPFIARYRKELTGSLDEVQIRDIQKSYQDLLDLKERKLFVLKTIEEQGQLTQELEHKILQAIDLMALEDLYAPYKKKKKTKADIAKEHGLQPLADLLLLQLKEDFYPKLNNYYSELFFDDELVLRGARDIIAEMVHQNDTLRNVMRNLFMQSALITSKVIKSKEIEAVKFKDYFQYSELLKKCPSHRYLALCRGEDEKMLRVSLEVDDDRMLNNIFHQYIKNNSQSAQQVKLAIEESYDRLLKPLLIAQVRQIIKEQSDDIAIKVFAKNLKQLLLEAPLGQKNVLAIDPGYRSGCKIVCLDSTGSLLAYETIYPHPPVDERAKGLQIIRSLVKNFNVTDIAIGDGTAGKETLEWLQESLQLPEVNLHSISEQGASIYSASDLARAEFPDLDVTIRGAISIGRRLMDPLAELIKIDPKSIGVGQYQHDVNQKLLREHLDDVVLFCVNAVGVNLNTASSYLLSYVSGLSAALSEQIVQYRMQHGAFESREALKQVPRLGPKAFEQCAGFLRIRNGKQILDNTGIHPERYELIEKISKDLGLSKEELIRSKNLNKQIKLDQYISNDIGVETLTDIIKELEKPGLDPRGGFSVFAFDPSIKKIEDLNEGMVLPAIVTNLTKFGAFVDLGIKTTGLIHVSEMSSKFINDPSEVLALREKIYAKVIQIDLARGRILMSIKDISWRYVDSMNSN